MRAYQGTVRVFLSLALASGIAACGASTPLGEQPTLSGQIEAWDKGAGYMLQAASEEGDAMLGTAPIDAAGNFSITLAGKEALTGKLQQVMLGAMPGGGTSACSGKVDISPQNFGMANLELRAGSGTTRLEIVHEMSGAIIGPRDTASYVYVDVDVDETGSIDCSGDGISANANYSVHFKAGWNRLVQTYRADGSSKLEVTFHTGDLPDGMTWRID